MTARIIDSWLKSGQEIAEIWCFDEERKRTLERQTPLGRMMAGWDTGALIHRHKIPVRICPTLKTWNGATAAAAATGADVLMTVMTHHIVPETLIRQFPSRAINVHPALLPHYKGPSPRVAMLVDGTADQYGGVTFHLLTRGIDEGAIIGQRSVPFRQAADYVLWDAMHAEAAAAIVETDLICFLGGRARETPQEPDSGSYRRVHPDEFRISPHMNLESVRRLCLFLGNPGLLVWKPEDGVAHGKETFFIKGFVKALGPPEGKPPRISQFHIDMDVVDARVRLRRRRKIDRLLQSPGHLGAMRHASRIRHSWTASKAAPVESDASRA